MRRRIGSSVARTRVRAGGKESFPVEKLGPEAIVSSGKLAFHMSRNALGPQLTK
jgi:hypothetical protein